MKESHDIDKKLGEQIKILRQFKDISQEELGTLAGLHRNFVGRVERGEQSLTLRSMEKVATALDVTVLELLQEVYNGK